LRVIGVRGGKAYHERKQTMNPNQENKNTRPWTQKGFFTN